MNSNLRPGNPQNVQRAEPIDWDRLRQASYENVSTAREVISHRPVPRILLAGLLIVGIGAPLTLLLFQSLQPGYVAHTIDIATRALQSDSHAATTRKPQLDDKQEKTAISRKVKRSPIASEYPSPLNSETIDPGLSTGEPLLIEVIDENGQRWFRGKDNQIRVTLERWQAFHKANTASSSRRLVPSSQGNNIFFLEVHHIGGNSNFGHAVVVLRGTVLPSGLLDDLALLSGPPNLFQQASQIVGTWTLPPRKEDGKPVNTPARIELRFNQSDVYAMAELFTN